MTPLVGAQHQRVQMKSKVLKLSDAVTSLTNDLVYCVNLAHTEVMTSLFAHVLQEESNVQPQVLVYANASFACLARNWSGVPVMSVNWRALKLL